MSTGAGILGGGGGNADADGDDDGGGASDDGDDGDGDGDEGDCDGNGGGDSDGGSGGGDCSGGGGGDVSGDGRVGGGCADTVPELHCTSYLSPGAVTNVELSASYLFWWLGTGVGGDNRCGPCLDGGGRWAECI